MTTELKASLPDRVCIWDTDKRDPTSTRGWTTSFQENHPDIYVRASAVTRAAPDVPELVRYSRIDTFVLPNPEDGYVLHSQAAAIIAAKDAEIEQAKKEINTLLVSFVREHFFENKTFQPLDSLIGQISQLDNAINYSGF